MMLLNWLNAKKFAIARKGTSPRPRKSFGQTTLPLISPRRGRRILRREPDGGYVLVTPVEKLDIEVEDAPFVAVEMKTEGEGRESQIAFRLNTGEMVTVSADHPLRFEEREDGPHPYVHVRGGLEALISRPLFYELAERALSGDDEPPGIWSGGAFFPIES